MNFFQSNEVLKHNTSNRVKGRVYCFSMQVVMNKFFLLNPENKFGANPSCRFRVNCKNRTFSSEKNDVTEPKARLLQLPVNLLTG